jgi:hypothetical protein
MGPGIGEPLRASIAPTTSMTQPRILAFMSRGSTRAVLPFLTIMAQFDG